MVSSHSIHTIFFICNVDATASTDFHAAALEVHKFSCDGISESSVHTTAWDIFGSSAF